MKRWTRMTIWVLALLPLAAAQADHRIDWEAWYAGEVDVNLQVKRGEGAVFQPGEPVRLQFRANENAYHIVFGIDTEGYVRLLFPRYWEDDGWVQAGRKVKLRAEDLAWPADRWGSEGIVYVEVVSSPTPFDFHAAGLVREASSCGWYDGHRILRVDGDPFLAFNDVHQRLFPDWDNALFAVDYTYFYVGDYYEAPRYLNYRYRRVYVSPPHSGFHVGIRFGWSWEFGYGHCRPVYARYYVPGVHYVHHNVYHHHHVAYRHHHHRYGHYGHYGYRDGWHGDRYRVVHDAKHERRITQPPPRKRHRSVARLREQLDQRAKRQQSVPLPETRKRGRSTSETVQRERSERAAESARKRIAEHRATPRHEAVQRQRNAPRRQAAEARRGTSSGAPATAAPRAQRRQSARVAPPPVERGSKSVQRGRSETRSKGATARRDRAHRVDSPRQPKDERAVRSKKHTKRDKSSLKLGNTQGRSRSKAKASKGSEAPESSRRVGAKPGARR